MKTLRAFWHWVDNEKPAEIMFKHLEPLSPVADRALNVALELVDERRWGGDADGHESLDTLRDQWPAIRDLSLAICQAIERMHEQVEPSEAMDVLREMYPEPEPGVPLTARRIDIRRPCNECGGYAFHLPHCSLHPPDCAPCRVMNEDGLKLRYDPNEFYGQMRSHYEEGRLEIFTSVTVDELNRFRGLAPHTIVLRGKPERYGRLALAHLANVVGPMRRDGAKIETPESSPTDWP